MVVREEEKLKIIRTMIPSSLNCTFCGYPLLKAADCMCVCVRNSAAHSSADTRIPFRSHSIKLEKINSPTNPLLFISLKSVTFEKVCC
jgi:hypothetical protein